MLTFQKLRKINIERCKVFHDSIYEWNLSEWGNAMAGECGEACNIIKKDKRGDLNIYDKSTDKKMLADELADLIIYADLLAARADINLDTAIISKFNEVSRRHNSTVFLEG